MRKKTKIMRFIWDILIIFFLAGFILALFGYINGSLEMIPTEEQQENQQENQSSHSKYPSCISNSNTCVSCSLKSSSIFFLFTSIASFGSGNSSV